MYKTWPCYFLVVLLTMGSPVAFGYHETLTVVVNGVRLRPAQIQVLEQLSCGVIPSGRYWLDVNTGLWGYEGGPTQGRITDGCDREESGSPADSWVGSPENDRFQKGAGGNVGGDGNTFYYFDRDTGSSVMMGN